MNSLRPNKSRDRRITVFSLILGLLLSGHFVCPAQGAPGDVDLSFDPGSGINGTVNAMVLQPDGKLLVGGDFTTANGLARNGIARLYPDGTGDASFKAEAPVDPSGYATWGAVLAIALQPDGKILAGYTYGIRRLNADGTLDMSFSADIGANWEDGTVHTIIVQPDGKAIIGGEFSLVNGTSRHLVARLNANGSLDRTFYVGAAVGVVQTLALQPDGRLLVSGYLAIDGTSRFTLVRLHPDGNLDSGFHGHETVADVKSIGVQSDGKVLVSNGRQLFRLNPDGRPDPGFHGPAIGEEPLDFIESVLVDPGGRILIRGGFTSVNNTARKGIARLHADGSLDSSFLPEPEPGGCLRLIALQADGRLIVGVLNPTDTVATHCRMVRLHSDGGLDNSFRAGAAIDERVASLVVQQDGKVLLGGSFTSVRGAARAGIARLNADGSLDNTFDPAVRFYATASHIRSVALQPDGKILIAGIFSIQNGNILQPKAVARLHADGSFDSTFDPDLSVYIPRDQCPDNDPLWYCSEWAEARTAIVQPDGRVIISGSGVIWAWSTWWETEFMAGRPFLARYHIDGSLDSSFRFGDEFSEAFVRRILRQPDGRILLVGDFKLNGTLHGVIRINSDGSLDNTFNPGVGINGYHVHSIALQADGRILIGGLAGWVFRFTGWHERAIGRLNGDGSVDDTFSPPSGPDNSVHSIALQPDGKVLIAGLLYSLSRTNGDMVARLHADGSRDTGFLRPDASGHVMIVTAQPDGHVLIGGDFTTLGGEARPHVARLQGDSPLPSLNIAMAPGSAVLSWPAVASNVRLEETAEPGLSGSWRSTLQPPVVNGNDFRITVPATGPRRFFRLTSP